MPPNRFNQSLMKPFVVLAIPGMYLVYKYNQFKRQQQENNRRKVAEKELQHLNQKIDKLLSKLDEHESDSTTISEEEECVVCLCAKATMQTYPCGHKVVCRKCFVKTIQVAVTQRCLPLRCVVCRSRILKLKQQSAPSNSKCEPSEKQKEKMRIRQQAVLQAMAAQRSASRGPLMWTGTISSRQGVALTRQGVVLSQQQAAAVVRQQVASGRQPAQQQSPNVVVTRTPQLVTKEARSHSPHIAKDPSKQPQLLSSPHRVTRTPKQVHRSQLQGSKMTKRQVTRQ